MNSFLKSYKMLAFAALLLALQIQAQAPMQDSVKADRVSLKRDGSYLTVGMTLRLSEVEAEGDRAVLITPLLENGGTNKALRPIGIYSRNRYFHYARQGKGRMLGGADELSFKEKEKPDGHFISEMYRRAQPSRQIVVYRRKRWTILSYNLLV